MDPGVVLNRGRDAYWAGRYKEALDDFIWFHENALQHDRAYYGVRLSFALGNWKDLADVYPPAKKALESARSRAVASLRAGIGDRYLFHDIVSINRELGKVRETYNLFREIWNKQPDLAKQCRDLAVEAIVEVGDFELASKCLPHPESYLLWLSDRLNEDLERKGVPRRTALRRREAYVRNYCSDVQTALRILKGLKNYGAARAFREWAIALVKPRVARTIVLQRLTSR
jgi:hypothetical protein